MGGRGALGAALIKMAVSPVKADREAIARVERECQEDIKYIAALLEDSEIVLLASTEEKQSNSKIIAAAKLIAAGIFWGGVVGIAAILIRPAFIWQGIGLGFCAGSACVVKDKNS